MKKLFAVLLLTATFTACGDDKTTESTTTGPESAPVTPGINNTSGNIPDTTKAIRLNEPQKIDSSAVRDSTPR